MSVIAIPTELLKLDEVVSFDLYVQQGDRFVLWRSKDYPLDQHGLEQLRRMGHRTVYVQQRERENLNSFMARRLDQILADESLGVARRAETAFESGNAAVRRLSDAPSPGGFEEVRRFARSFTGFVLQEHDAMREVFRLAGLEMHHFTHSTHVAALAVNLARRGTFSQDEIEKLALACLVRDLGMGRLPLQIRGAQGKLSEADLEVVKEHVRHTRSILEDAGASDPLVKTVVLQHHERADGSGYPAGLPNDKISPLSMIAAIADTYGALLTRRPYREPMRAFDALKLMLARQAGKFDDGWMKILIELLSKD